MKIVICSSLRYRKELTEFVKELTHLGIRHVSVPDFSHLSEDIISAESETDRQNNDFYRKQLPYIAKAWINEVRKADVVFFFNKNGYMGINTTLELGVAIGMDKIIGALENDIKEPCRHIFFDFVANTAQELTEYIR